ncbi:MAG: hypothetical protein ACT4TC_15175 [Myxococcaceae bacterium]
MEQVAGQLKNAEDNLRVVETQYTERPEPSADEALLRRFSAGEIHHLLGEFAPASVLFYDLVQDNRFKGSPRYPDALWFLADSLFQQQNFIGTKVYLRELINTPQSKWARPALARYLEVSGRLNEFEGIEDYISKARAGSPNGELPPELAYVYGKWLFKRQDISRDERLARSDVVFAKLAGEPGAYRLQAQYFLGVAEVQRAELEPSARADHFTRALDLFKRVVTDVDSNEKTNRLKELANLSMGRVFYELGGEEGLRPELRDSYFTQALDRYQEIPRESEHFVDSLYEIAWVQVKRDQFEKAKNATDILLLVAPDSTLAPEAQILQGHLQLKLQRYNDATETYTSVINTYAPVRDELDALLTVNKDPVAYFDNLLARNTRSLDATSLLPPVAHKWATAQREVADALRIVGDLEKGRRGVTEAEEIANNLLKAIDERGLEAFPAIQEGYTRADAVDSAIAQQEQALVRIEGRLIRSVLAEGQLKELERLQAATNALRERVATLPTTSEEVQARRDRMRGRVDGVDKDAFKLGYEIQSMKAIVTAVEKWLGDTKPQRKNTAEEEKEFAQRLKLEVDGLSSLQDDLDVLRRALAVERASSDATIAGESELRDQFEAHLKREHELIAAAESGLGADAQRVIARAHEIRGRSVQLRQRVATAKAVLREQLTRRGKLIRDTVTAERALLAKYGAEVGQVSGSAGNLVGRIAFDSFKRVRQQFYELVLKADVGVVDVSFTRKQDKTAEIQKLSTQKDHDLRALDEEFREVLKDVE